jgi:hypothetical protein
MNNQLQPLFNGRWYPSLNEQLGDNCIVFENFTASIGDLMIGN